MAFEIGKVTAASLIARAKYQLYDKFPFFSYMVEHLRISEDLQCPTAYVTNNGLMGYNPKYIEEISKGKNNNEKNFVTSILAHEVLHLALLHHKRMGKRDLILQSEDGSQVSLWNLAIDIIVNNIINMNSTADLPLHEDWICPKDNSITMFGVTINDIDAKSAEEIYDLLIPGVEKTCKKGKGKGKGKSSGSSKGEGEPEYSMPSNASKGQDEHKFKEPKENGEGEGSAEKIGEQGEEKDWTAIMEQAFNHAKQKGKAPLGMGRDYKISGKSKVNWRFIIHKEIGKRMPVDYSWNKPSRRGIGIGCYLPSTVKEGTTILFSIDTSGSISEKELSDYMTEIFTVVRSFKADIHVITHDSAVHNDHRVEGNENKLRQIAINGGGGTSHIPLYDYISKKRYDRSHTLLISFTDGESDYPSRPCIDTIFILPKNHRVRSMMPKWGKVIEM